MKENDDAVNIKCAKRKDVRGLVGVRGQKKKYKKPRIKDAALLEEIKLFVYQTLCVICYHLCI